ncbi:MAG: SAM-dependent methyltransferase [Woeseiaceae bacterium]|nr:SAM-dependent methyltransferase [Woeseiaceae bacterium]NIP21117.1 SAM-dependent methyltransferase [Woeseiaceae bacterium]NIS90089.1 SAM-dependent methyltransferase [Woeseiaceae bacterium]
MTSRNPLFVCAAVMLLASTGASGKLAEGFDDALVAPERPAGDKDRDENRHPREVLEFGGIGAGMTVLDVAAGSGWYTEVLSAAVGPEGHVIAHNSVQRRARVEEAMTARADRLGNVTPLYAETGAVGLDAEADAALTALNLHDYASRGTDALQAFLTDIYAALRPGGVFIVIDHEGSAGNDNSALHRMELSAARAALEEAGFVVEAASDILDNPDDDHSLHMRDESLGRNTDRFLIRARKPE